MIGTLLIAVVGYGAALGLAVFGLIVIVMLFQGDFKNREAGASVIGLLSLLFALALAALTRWLTGGAW